MLTIFTHAHCFDICSLFLYMLTEFIYAHWVYIRSLFLYMLTVFICGHCFYICSLFLYMLTEFTYAHCFYIWSLSLYMLTEFIYAYRSTTFYKSKFLIYMYRSTTFFLLWHSLLTLVWCCCIWKQCLDVLCCQAKWWPAPQGQEAFGNRLELQVCQATLRVTGQYRVDREHVSYHCAL
jgi:hypothetical protein